MSFVSSDVISKLSGWTSPLIGQAPYNKKVVEDNAQASAKLLDVLEQHLLVHTFLVGERVTLADLFTVGLLSFAFKKVRILFSLDQNVKDAREIHGLSARLARRKSEGQRRATLDPIPSRGVDN